MSEANLVLFALLGGTALLLFGVRLVGEGLQRAAGTRLRHVLSTLTGDRFRALLVGAGVTAVLQSSSATTVMLVGFASAGLLSLRQTIGVILGADIGTTVTVQLLAFNLLGYAPLVVFLGWLVYTAFGGPAKYIGQAILGFGFLFVGMKLIADGTVPLKESALFGDLFSALVGQPLLLLLLAAVFSALVRSSAATIGIGLSFAAGCYIALPGSLRTCSGATWGTAAPALVAAVGENAEARRVAAAHAVFKVIGVLIFLPLSVAFADLVRRTTDDPARQIANAHSLFNLAVALLFLPFTRVAADVFTRLIPDTGRRELGAMYLNPNVLDTPAVALGQAVREVLRMGDAVLQSLRETIAVLDRDDEALMREVIRRDDLIDRLEEDIKQYVVKLGEQARTEEQSGRDSALLFTLANPEELGDVIEKEIIELPDQKKRGHHRRSAQGWAEIVDLHGKVVENLELALSAVATQDHSIAEKVVRHKSNINLQERRLRQTHMQRLHEGLRETIDTSSIHLDVLAALKRANSLVAGIAYAVLGQHDVE